MTSRETLARLRDVLARELETISIYEAHAEAETDPQMKTLFQHLADEEKEHVTEVYEALLGRDVAQKTWAESGLHAQAIREGRFSEATAGSPSQGTPGSPSPPAAAPASAPPAVVPAPAVARGAPPMSSVRTVGSLHGLPGPTAGDSVVSQPPAATPIVAPVVKPLAPGEKSPGIRPTPPTIGSLFGLPQA